MPNCSTTKYDSENTNELIIISVSFNIILLLANAYLLYSRRVNSIPLTEPREPTPPPYSV